MRVALLDGRERLELREVAEPDPTPGGVVVSVRYCGICGTDVHAFRTGDPYPPILCGHEWTGTVAKAGAEVTAVAEGDRVCVGILPACGACADCRAGHPEQCLPASLSIAGGDPDGSDHGGYAPFVRVGQHRVVPVPDGLDDIEAALVEPATVAFHGVRRSRLRVGDRVVVQGAGPIGLFALQWAVAAGAGDVVVVEPTPARAELARQLGADLVVDPGPGAIELVRERTRGVGADLVLECAGRPETVQSAIGLARRGGSVMVIGLAERDLTINPGMWLMSEVALDASIAYLRAEFDVAMSLMADGRVRAAPLHTRTVGLGELATVLGELSAGSPEAKVLVDPRA